MLIGLSCVLRLLIPRTENRPLQVRARQILSSAGRWSEIVRIMSTGNSNRGDVIFGGSGFASVFERSAKCTKFSKNDKNDIV